MKSIFTLIIIILASNVVFAQAPQAIPYQAVARNSSGAILASTNVSVRFTIRDSVATGTIRYRETHSITTTPQGLFTANVGGGTPITGTFSNINWATNAKFLQVEIDPAGGSSYIDMGTQQMMSVPYALNAASVKLRVSATGDTLYTGGGNYTIVPGVSAANCTTPIVEIIAGASGVCVGNTTTLTNTTVGGIWTSSATGIATVGSTGIVTGIATGTATISYTVTNSCGSTTTTRTIDVNELPSAGTITGSAIVCVGGTTTLSNAITGGTWSSSNLSLASVGSTGIVTGFSSGTVTISYTVSNTCGSNTATQIVSINTSPSVGGIAGTASVCVGSTTTLFNTTSGGSWTSSNAATATVGSTGVVTGVAAGTVVISYTVTNSCGSNVTSRVVTVNGIPSAGSIVGATSVCVGSTTTLSNATTGGSWTSSNTSRATVNSSGVVTGVSTGTVVISYHVFSVCGTNFTTHIATVNAAPSAGTITGTATVTAGSTTTLSNATTGGTWSSSNTGIATVGTSGVVTGVAAGTATISYTISSTCGSAVATTIVTVNAALTIGTTFGGGVIAYILQPGDPGYVAGETHGLIAAPSDQSTGIHWGCVGTYISGTSTALGTGAANTAIIASAACGTGTAAKLCDDLVLGGYSDWYLPSRDELNKLYINRSSIGGFATGYYWSSSQHSASNAWLITFNDGNTFGNSNFATFYVRAVRSF